MSSNEEEEVEVDEEPEQQEEEEEEKDEPDEHEEDEQEEEEDEDKIPEKPLVQELIDKSLSVLAATDIGVQLAYVRLDIKEKELTSISLLSEFPHLRFIDISGNTISDISCLNNVKELCTLTASQNQLTSAALEPHAHLQTIDVSDNKLESVAGIAHPTLKTLKLAGNALTNVENLTSAQLPLLQVLSLERNLLQDLSSIQLPTLTVINLDENGLANLSSLSALVCLQSLSLKKNQLTTLDGFSAANAQLSEIFLDENQLESMEEISKLECLPHLTTLSLEENPGEFDEMAVLVAILQLKELNGQLLEPDQKKEAAEERNRQDALKADEEAAAKEDA